MTRQVLHRMHYVLDGKSACWVCDDCPKRVRVKPDLARLERGDRTALHIGSAGGLTITEVEIRSDFRLPTSDWGLETDE